MQIITNFAKRIGQKTQEIGVTELEARNILSIFLVEFIALLKDSNSRLFKYNKIILEDIFHKLLLDTELFVNNLKLVDKPISRYNYDFNFAVDDSLEISVMIPNGNNSNDSSIKVIFNTKDNPILQINGERIIFYLNPNDLGEQGFQNPLHEKYGIGSEKVGEIYVQDQRYYIYYTYMGEI